jgi:hypothetical protein
MQQLLAEQHHIKLVRELFRRQAWNPGHVRAVATAAHTATTTLRSAVKATKASDAVRISVRARGCCCQRGY